MVTIATLAPEGSHAWQAVRLYNPDARLVLLPNPTAVINALSRGEAQQAVLPSFNTREGRNPEFFQLLNDAHRYYWQDNVVLPIHLSLGVFADHSAHRQEGAGEPLPELSTIVGRAPFLRQCEEYIGANFPRADLMAVRDLDRTVVRLKSEGCRDFGVIEAEDALRSYGLELCRREISPHNRTRFAVLGSTLPSATGYDATAVITSPLKDRVGLLYEMMGAFAQRGINLLDMASEIEPESQRLRFFLEMEGHADDPAIREVLSHIEKEVIHEQGRIRVLGAYPRVDMRTKRIKRCGFIGSGEMSKWFADRLTGEGYEVMLTGRSTPLPPEEMVPRVDLLAICVPISATVATVRRYGPMLKKNQALILLAGEAEASIEAALESTDPEVEVMLVHNLWGPKAAGMKDKNASLVRTPRSGVLCSEFEAFLYKHGAVISQDSGPGHNLLMGVSQKLPSATAIALAMTLRRHQLPLDEIERHSTLTSAYLMLTMARVHFQNPRTYAEILACPGEGGRILRDYATNLLEVLELAEAEDIEALCKLIEVNRAVLGDDFLRPAMEQALAVDNVLGSRRP